MKKDTQVRPRFLLVTNPSIPKRQGVTLEPVEEPNWDTVRVRQSTRAGNSVFTGCAGIDATGEPCNPIISLDIPDAMGTEAIVFVAEMVRKHGITDARSRPCGLSVVPGGLLS